MTSSCAQSSSRHEGFSVEQCGSLIKTVISASYIVVEQKLQTVISDSLFN